jgi:4-methoxybenzoate monooxygenase (O-demethylating)
MTAVVHNGSLPVTDDDPFSHGILTDPSDFHLRLREAGPLVYLRRYGVYAMGRFAEVDAALRDWQGFQSAAGVGLSNFRYEKPWRPPSVLLEADPPRHDAPRMVLEKILGPRALRRLRASWFAAAEELVDEVVEQREFDAMPALAQAFPLRVFPDAVGLPDDDGRANLLSYGDHNFNTFGPANDLVAKGAARVPELSAWVDAQCARDRLRAGATFGSAIYAAADHGDVIAEQAPLMVRSLLTAGVDTTVHGIGAVLHALANNPEQWQALRAAPQLARTAFDEAVRLQSPVQIFFRTATRDVTVGDVTVPDGQKLLMFLASANRDPRRWADPDRFDLARDPSGHVGFGAGIHQCVGQHVARLEVEALLTALMRRVKTIRFTAPPTRHLNNSMSAFATLPVRVELA